MSDDHHTHDRSTVAVAVLTVSSSRSAAEDAAGDTITTAITDAGHDVAARDLVTDDEGEIRETIREFASRAAVDAVVTTGGTGISPEDVTVEAVRPLFDRELPGFGERFRAVSVEDVGPPGMLSRATAGVSGGVPIFCLPGSEAAARLGAGELIVPILGHVVGLASSDRDHDRGEHDD